MPNNISDFTALCPLFWHFMEVWRHMPSEQHLVVSKGRATTCAPCFPDSCFVTAAYEESRGQQHS